MLQDLPAPASLARQIVAACTAAAATARVVAGAGFAVVELAMALGAAWAAARAVSGWGAGVGQDGLGTAGDGGKGGRGEGRRTWGQRALQGGPGKDLATLAWATTLPASATMAAALLACSRTVTGFTSADNGGFLALPDGSLDLMSAVPGAAAAAAAAGAAPLSPRHGYISDAVPAAQWLVAAGSSLTHSPLVEVVAGEEGLGARGTGGGGGCSSDEDEAQDFPPVRLVEAGTRRQATADLDGKSKGGVNGARQETGEDWRARMRAMLDGPAGRQGAAGGLVAVSPHGLVRTTGAFGSGEGGPGWYAAAGAGAEQEDSGEEAAGCSSDGTGLGSEVEAGGSSLTSKHRRRPGGGPAGLPEWTWARVHARVGRGGGAWRGACGGRGRGGR